MGEAVVANRVKKRTIKKLSTNEGGGVGGYEDIGIR